MSNNNIDTKNINYTMLNSNITKVLLESKENLNKLYCNYLDNIDKGLDQHSLLQQDYSIIYNLQILIIISKF